MTLFRGFLLIIIIILLREYNVDLIYRFLNKKDSELIPKDELDLNTIDYDINYKKAKELSWYLLGIEICVIGFLFMICVSLGYI